MNTGLTVGNQSDVLPCDRSVGLSLVMKTFHFYNTNCFLNLAIIFMQGTDFTVRYISHPLFNLHVHIKGCW